MGHGFAQGLQISRVFTMYYCGTNRKELEHCMAISPMTPFLSSSQYIIVLSYHIGIISSFWWDFLPFLPIHKMADSYCTCAVPHPVNRLYFIRHLV